MSGRGQCVEAGESKRGGAVRMESEGAVHLWVKVEPPGRRLVPAG